MKRVIIVGARQHAKVVCHILQTSKRARNHIEVVGFVDDDPKLGGAKLLGLPVLGRFSDLPDLIGRVQVDAAIIGISNRHMNVRRKYFEGIKKLGLEPVSAIHDAAVIDEGADVRSGLVLNPLCVVNAFARVGNNVVAYSAVTIEHEDIISDNVYFGPGVNLTSGVKIGSDTFIGAGTKVTPDVVIGSGVTIGAGSVVLHDVPDNSVVAGAPAKVIKSE